MRDPTIDAFAREFARIDKDMTRLYQGVSVPEHIAEHLRRQGQQAEVLSRQLHVGEHLSRIGELPTQESMAAQFAPAAHELVASLYAPPLSKVSGVAAAAEIGRATEDMFASLGSAALGIGSIVAQIKEQVRVSNEVRSLFPTHDLGRFMGVLPDLMPVGALLDDIGANQGRAALEENDFGFASFLLSRRILASVAWIAKPVQAATITRRLTGLTRKEEFRAELESEMSQSVVLRRRWPIVERALKAHTEGDYFLSIPALLPQVEGAMADALRLKGTVAVRKGKLYRKNPKTGKLKRDKHGKPIQITGAKQLLEGRPLQEHPILQEVAEVLASQLVGEHKMFDDRNLILHGRKLNYNKANLSTRSLLVLLTVAPDIAAFEAGQIESDMEG